MGKRRYPPLKHAQMIAIFRALGFAPVRHGDHEVWEKPAVVDPNGVITSPRRAVPIGDYEEFDATLIKRMIPETGFTREQFYKSCKDTAKKI
jgi:hypothetical protein